jgi:hypothetical protein
MARRLRYPLAASLILGALGLAGWLAWPVRMESAMEWLFPWVHHLTKQPWLQRPSPTAITVCYEVDAPGDGFVKFGDGKHLARSAPAALHQIVTYAHGVGYVYRARLGDLAPAATYRYRVVHDRQGGKQVRSDVARFTTWAEAARRATFIVYGDSRSNPDAHGRIARQFDRYQPAFILHTGDAVHSGWCHEQWEPQFFEPLEAVIDHVPLFIACGNHDGTAEDLLRWFDLPGGHTWYSFDCGPVHVAVLDSYDQTPEAAQWLEKDLAGAKAPWKLVAYHMPISPYDYYVSEFDRQTLLPLLDRYGVDVAIAGHNHSYERFKPVRLSAASGHALTLITTGGGGAPLHPVFDDPALARALSEHHYCVFTAEPERLMVDVFDVHGRPLDRLMLTKEGGRLDPAYVSESRVWNLP